MPSTHILWASHADDPIWEDPQAVIDRAAQSPRLSLRYAPPPIRDNRDVVRAILLHEDRRSSARPQIAFASERLRDDLELARIAVQMTGATAYPYLSERLRDDRDLLLFAVAQKWHPVLKYASFRLRCDRDTLVAVMNLDGSEFKEVPILFRHDPEVIAAAVANDGAMLRNVPHDLCTREVVLAAVTSYGYALAMVRAEYGDDREIVEQAVQPPCGDALQYASDRLKTDLELVRVAVQSSGNVIDIAGVQDNPELVALCVATCQSDVLGAIVPATPACRADIRVQRALLQRTPPEGMLPSDLWRYTNPWWDRRLVLAYPKPVRDFICALLMAINRKTAVRADGYWLPVEMVQHVLSMVPWRAMGQPQPGAAAVPG